MPNKDPIKNQEVRRRYREANREKIREYDKRYYAENAAKRAHTSRYTADGNIRPGVHSGGRERSRKYKAKARDAVVSFLGNKCVRCGYADTRALCIDHVNGGGNAHRKSFKTISKYYSHICANREDYQILCCNCNAIKRIENGEHTKKQKY